MSASNVKRYLLIYNGFFDYIAFLLIGLLAHPFVKKILQPKDKFVFLEFQSMCVLHCQAA
jgi:hypothetical protein